jgi:hypothetical protein
MKHSYEEEIIRLRRELEARGIPIPVSQIGSFIILIYYNTNYI